MNPPAQAHPVAPSEPDHLASAVMRSLGRSCFNLFSLSPLRAAVLALFTIGIGPFFRLSKQFRDVMTFERQQLAYLTEWLRTRGGGQEAAALADMTKTLDQREGTRAIGWCLILVGCMGMFAMLQDRFSVDSILNATYRFQQIRRDTHDHRFGIAFSIWNVSLILAYFTHWIQVRAQTRDIERWVSKFNVIAQREGVEPVVLPPPGRATNIWWIIVGVLFAMSGSYWAVPMVLAAATQRRYINATGQHLRGLLIGRMRTMLLNRRPAVAVPNYVLHGRRCENALCQATLPAGAQFCPRCGSTVAQARVA